MRTTAALLALPLSLLSAGESLEYRATADTSVRVTYEQTAELALVEQEVVILVDGEEHPAGEQPDVDVTLTMHETTVFVDTYSAVNEESHPTKIERHFEKLDGGYGQEVVGLPDDVELPEPITVVSELEDQKTVFEWDEKEGAWTASAPEDSDYDQDLLAELEQNADLSYFLPGKEVAVEDSWELEAEAFRQLLNISGDLDMKPEDDESEDEDDDREEEWTAELFRLTLTEATEDSVTIKIEADVNRHEEGDVDPGPMPEGMDMDPPTITDSEDLQWVAEGELVWDLANNRAISLSLAGSLSREFESVQEMSGPMGEVSITQAQTFEGTFDLSITYEAADKGDE